MASFFNRLLGNDKPKARSDSSDFADFANPVVDAAAPEPLPLTGTAAPADPASPTPAAGWAGRYGLQERRSLSDFRFEGVVLALLVVLVVSHFVGGRANRSRARAWIRAHAPALRSEFAFVGADDAGNGAYQPNTAAPLASPADADALLGERSPCDFGTRAAGRANVSFLDVSLGLVKRYDPLTNIADHVLGYFLDAYGGLPRDAAELIAYPLDGRDFVPGAAELRAKDGGKGTYDNFVFAVVNKHGMRRVRDERYDASITVTRDHPKLPFWATVMSEHSEITDALLTPEFVDAVKVAGELFDYIIISDQPADRPKSDEEAAPKKRIILRHRLPADGNHAPLVPLVQFFLRLPDVLVRTAHFRPEVRRRIQKTREDLAAMMRREAEGDKAEGRAATRDKVRRAKRDAELNALDAKSQKKYLDKEREKELRKAVRRVKG